MRKLRHTLPTCLVLMGAGLSHEANAAMLTVTSLADAGPGTLRDQVAAAAPGDTINFSVTGTIQLVGDEITINKNLTITGPGASSLTVAGNIHDSIFTIGGGTVGISGLTLTNGGGTLGYGGAIYMSAGTSTIAECTVSNNYGQYGAGIAMTSGSMAIERSTISNNGEGHFGHGGGIYVGGGSLAVTDSNISGNIGGYGAGLLSEGGDTTVTLTNTTLSGNIAKNDGGHLYSVFSIELQKFYDVFVFYDGSGGGIYNIGATVNIVNSTLSGNRAESHEETSGTLGGGGIWNAQTGTLKLANTTITGNYSEIGGGIRNYGTLVMSNSLVAGNTSSSDDIWGMRLNGDNTVVGGDYNLVQSSEFTTFTGTHNILGQEAKLGPLLNNGGPTQTHRLLARSPALDAGDPAFVAPNLPYDQRGPGFPRIYNGRVCIGSFESEANQSGPSVIVNSLDDHDDATGGVTDCTLREAVNHASPGAIITFSVAGTITLTGGELLITKNLTIIGPAGAPGITVSGNNASRIFRVTQGAVGVSNTVNFSNLTLSGGNGASSFQSGVGGAIHSDTYTPPMIMAVTNCTFSGNHAETGGAIRNGGTLTVTGSTFTGNSGSINAGAIQNGPNVLTLTNSTFSGNSTTGIAANGNGIGGALRTTGSPTVTNCTFSGNTATNRGGGIEIAAGATPSFSNTIVAGNSAPTGPDIFGTVTAGDYNLVQNMANATLAGTHNLSGPANLGALADNGGPTLTHALLPGSPALNVGGNALIPGGVTTDQRGSARVESGTVDIGAFELDTTPPSLTINQAAGQTDPTISTPVHFTVVFSEAVTAFTTGDVTLSGTAGATSASVTGIGPTYQIAVTGMTRTGTVIATVAASVAPDISGNANTVSTSTDNSIYYSSAETVQHSGTIHAVEGGGGGYDVGFIGNPGQEYTIQFSSTMAPTDWHTLTTQVADGSGVISIIDNPPPGTPKRFYRMLLP